MLPLSVYERAGQALFNTVVIVDADGSVLGHYRKSHIPDGPGYTEKYYFSPGDTGFRVWDTRHGMIGVGICWDQWFPEIGSLDGAARRRGAVLPDGDRQRTARSDLGLERPLAACDAGTRRGEPDAGRRGEPHRTRGRPDVRDHVLRVVVHRRQHGCQGRRGRPRRRGGARRDRSIASSCAPSGPPGACSATAVPSSTARSSPSTAPTGPTQR